VSECIFVAKKAASCSFRLKRYSNTFAQLEEPSPRMVTHRRQIEQMQAVDAAKHDKIASVS